MVETNLRAEHWFEIEKRFDLEANEAQLRMISLVKTLDPLAKNSPKIESYLKEQVEETIDAFDVFRTISAVAARARKQCEAQEQSVGATHEAG